MKPMDSEYIVIVVAFVSICPKYLMYPLVCYNNNSRFSLLRCACTLK